MKKQQTGIWLDSKEAIIVHLGKDEPQVQTFESDIHTREIEEDPRNTMHQRPHINISENRELERLKHTQTHYFETLQQALQTADEIYIFGPGEMKKHLSKFLESDHNFRPQILEVDAADSMTQNQLVAKVKDFFGQLGA